MAPIKKTNIISLVAVIVIVFSVTIHARPEENTDAAKPENSSAPLHAEESDKKPEILADEDKQDNNKPTANSEVDKNLDINTGHDDKPIEKPDKQTGKPDDKPTEKPDKENKGDALGTEIKDNTDCKKNEKKQEPPRFCALPINFGNCDNFSIKWAYVKEKKRCFQFIHTGCISNRNNFETYQECTKICSGV